MALGTQVSTDGVASLISFQMDISAITSVWTSQSESQSVLVGEELASLIRDMLV